MQLLHAARRMRKNDSQQNPHIAEPSENIKERHIYDGLYHYRKPKDKKDMDLLIVAALYDLHNRIKAADKA